jgi:hypothetical protein
MARTKRDIDVPNLTGKLAVVTGASDGLGLGDWNYTLLPRDTP